jgi:hypothetical protein
MRVDRLAPPSLRFVSYFYFLKNPLFIYRSWECLFIYLSLLNRDPVRDSENSFAESEGYAAGIRSLAFFVSSSERRVVVLPFLHLLCACVESVWVHVNGNETTPFVPLKKKKDRKLADSAAGVALNAYPRPICIIVAYHDTIGGAVQVYTLAASVSIMRMDRRSSRDELKS